MPPRKRKRRALEAHLDGLSAEERFAILSAFDDELPAQGAVDASSDGDGLLQDGSTSAVDEGPPPIISRFNEEERQARRRTLRTSWRMAVFSQFCAAFPHLCLKEFDIEALELDLDGTAEGSYVGEVISRLLYTLTRDSRLAGKDPDKPWLFSLRREYLKRDPAHNSLGEEPYYFDQDYPEESSALSSKQSPSIDAVSNSDVKPDISITLLEAPETAKPVPGEAEMLTATSVLDGITAKSEMTSIEQENALLGKDESGTTYKGWEALGLEEQIHALWSVCEWHLFNADKFRNALTKSRVEEDHVVWRIEPVGYDAAHNTYWLFDDNRLWIERETSRKRELRVITEEAAKKNTKKQEAREKRLLREQRRRMKALHEARRIRMESRRAQDEQNRNQLESLLAQVDNEDENVRESRAVNGKKRKWDGEESDTDEFEAADYEDEGTRSSSRINRVRLRERLASRPPRRRSTRMANTNDSNGPKGAGAEEDWQQIPPEWLKSEDQEKNEDPDFGAAADGDEDGADAEGTGTRVRGGSESDLSLLEEEMPVRTASSRVVSRRSPRKILAIAAKTVAEESDHSANSANDNDLEESDEEEEEDQIEDQHWPDSAYDLGPSFDDEGPGLAEGFTQWEAICTNLEEWLAFESRFKTSTDSNERALVTYVNSTVLPGVQAAFEAREAEDQRKAAIVAAAEKAAARKARMKQQAPLLQVPTRQSRHRSSRLAVKESIAEEERRKNAAMEPLNYYAARQGSGEISESTGQKVVETDRRAARARQREEEKRSREEAELIAELAATEEGVDINVESDTVEPEVEVKINIIDVPIDTSMDVDERGVGLLETGPLEIEGDDEVDFYLDCSICRRRGVNLDVNQRLVQCDTCDRWEHVVCHRKADEKFNRPKRDFDSDPFQCEDCEGIGEESIVIPKAAKRERSDAQKAGAQKGALKRRAKHEAQRLQRAAKDQSFDDNPSSAAKARIPSKVAPLLRDQPKSQYIPYASSGNSKRKGRASAENSMDDLPTRPNQFAQIPSRAQLQMPETIVRAAATHQDNGLMPQSSVSTPQANVHPMGELIEVAGSIRSGPASDIAIDPNLASRPGTPMSRTSTLDGGTAPMVPLPSFLISALSNGPPSSSQAPLASLQAPLPDLSTGLSDIPIPGLSKAQDISKVAVPLPDFLLPMQ